jgi:probable phosphoglycerate mutase
MTHPVVPVDQRLRFIRHGATALNQAGLRCGGDLDVPLVAAGRAQVRHAVPSLARLQPALDLIITSDLRRTQETAHLIAQALGGVRIVIEPGLSERRLGEWNGQPAAQTHARLVAGETPPGGESDAEFNARIRAALHRIRPLLGRQPLLVGSKGVARVLGELAGLPGRLSVDNAALVVFDLAAMTWDAPAHRPAAAPPRAAAAGSQALAKALT